MSKFLKKLWHQTKTRGEDIGLSFLIIGFSVVILLGSLGLAGVPIEATLSSTLLSLGLALISVGLGFTSVGMSAKSDKRQTDLLERLDKNVAELPLLFKGDILTPSGHKAVKAVKELREEQIKGDILTPSGHKAVKAVKELREEQSKEAAQKRLDEDTRKVGHVRGELFQNEDGNWAIHWGGKYSL